MTKGRAVDPATRARIVAEATRLYQSGLSLRDTADEVGIPYTTAHSWLTAAGVPLRPGQRNGPLPVGPETVELRAVLQGRYYGGQTVQEIADSTGLPYGGVRYHLRAAGTVFRSTGRRTNKFKEQQA